MPSSHPQPSFVLVRPQMGENIGAAARGMWNFGLDRMRVVAPRYGWPSQKAVAMASGAGRLLDEAGHFQCVEDALTDAHFVLATTARPRGLTKPVLSPEEAMRQAAARINRGENVAIMFGPERSGLENEDIAQANAIVSVPVNPDFPSLNLAQCALLLGYEWRRATQTIVHDAMEMAKTEWAQDRVSTPDATPSFTTSTCTGDPASGGRLTTRSGRKVRRTPAPKDHTLGPRWPQRMSP